ncbi:RhoGAP-domain-containing protein [Auricularia subglabra TFB-10046 SS5]|nr:RhoGAP-domain-containing protein [Auricularia subglabra TFB-10046 SS5]
MSSPSDTADGADQVDTNFDESVLRALCDLDCSVPLLLDRIKQGMVSCREASTFFKKRAVLEEEYGRNLQKLARSTSETYSMSDGKAGTFVSAWQTSMKIHDVMADNRIKFAQRLNEMSDDLATLAKEVDKNRKQTKELAARFERTLQDSEITTERAKGRFDVTAEELERVLLQKEGETLRDTAVQGQNRSPGLSGAGSKRALGKAVQKGGLLLKGKNPNNMLRQEEDVRTRMSAASDVYRKAVLETQTIRQEYFNFQLPRILRSLKECADEIDKGVQYHLGRYAFLFESIVLNDGTTLSPMGVEDGPGLRPTFHAIDNRADFRVFMQNYAVAYTGPRGPRRDGPWEEGFMSTPIGGPLSSASSTTLVSQLHGSPGGIPVVPQDRGRPTFGVDLAEQMIRDNVEVPRVMVRLCAAIEKWGAESTGIYRLSGSVSKVAKLKALLDRDVESVDLDSEEWTADVNVVTSVMKMWLRELPEPIISFSLAQGFTEAARIENDRLRHIRLHERVNDLPDANYSTLKYFLGHLHRIAANESINQMSISNLSIVFGPTLFGFQTMPTPNANGSAGANGAGPVAVPDTQMQNRVSGAPYVECCD